MSQGRRIGPRLRAGFSLALTGLVAVLFVQAFDLGRTAGAVPRWVLGVTLGLLALQALRDARHAMAASRSSPPIIESEPINGVLRRVGATLLGFVCLLAAVGLVGLPAGSALFLGAWLRWRTALSWPGSLAVAAGFGFGLWVLFDVLLGAPLFAGRFGP